MVRKVDVAECAPFWKQQIWWASIRGSQNRIKYADLENWNHEKVSVLDKQLHWPYREQFSVEWWEMPSFKSWSHAWVYRPPSWEEGRGHPWWGTRPRERFCFQHIFALLQTKERSGGGLLEAGREVKLRAVFCWVLASVIKDPAFWETSTFLDASQKPAQKIKSPLSRINKLVKHQTKCSSPEAGEMAWWVIKALVTGAWWPEFRSPETN